MRFAQQRGRPESPTPSTHNPARTGPSPRIGFFGLLGSGNIGNDGSLDVAVNEVRARYPEAQIGFLCAGPDVISARCGLPATRLNWYSREYETAARPSRMLMKALGKIIDIPRTIMWVRRFDLVIVPGMGTLAADLPIRPWGFPYSTFLLCAAGRLVRTKVAFVSVGSDSIRNFATRRLYLAAAKLATYRSYRDARSRQALAAMGVDTSADHVFPDLVFGMPTPGPMRPTRTVAVGVMDYHGGNDDRAHADRLHADYVEAMKRLVRWLVVDQDRDVILITGDPSDEHVAADIVRDSHDYSSDGRAARVKVCLPQSLMQLMEQLAPVSVVIAMRYHNLLCALKLLKPAISVGYSGKNRELLASVGLGGDCHSAATLDLELLQEQFVELESLQATVRPALAKAIRVFEQQVQEQFDEISETLFPANRRPAISHTRT